MGASLLALAKSIYYIAIYQQHVRVYVRVRGCSHLTGAPNDWFGFETWGNKTKEIYYSLLSLKMISFVSFS